MDLIFQIPWWVVAGLVIAGIGLFVYGNNRLNKKLQRAGVGVILLAGLWALVSYLVDTDVEVSAARSRQFVQAVVDQDSATLARLLHSPAQAGSLGKDQIARAACYYAQKSAVQSARITSLSAERQGDQIAVVFSVFSQHNDSSMIPQTTLPSSWEFDWQKQGNQWLLSKVIPLKIGGISRDQIEQMYLSHSPQ